MGWKSRVLLNWTVLHHATGIQFDEVSSSSSSESRMSPAWCPVECDDCDELGNCLQCNKGFILQSFECVESCMDGFFESNLECHECPIECSQCNSETECTKCRRDYYHEGHVCVDQCSIGHFLTEDTCLPCPENCSECWERNECTECIFGKFLLGSECVDQCTKGFTGTQGICLPCETGCDVCDAESQKCIKCEFGLFLHHSHCVKECPKNTVSDSRGWCRALRIKVPHNQLLRLSNFIDLPTKTADYKVKFSKKGTGHIFRANQMDGSWPTYILPDWKQPMALDSETLLPYTPERLSEITGDDLDNTWYRPDARLVDNHSDVLNYQVFRGEELIEESELDLEILTDAVGQIKPGPESTMMMIIPPGSTRKLSGLRFTSRDDVLPEDIVYNINSRLPPGFATVERPPYGPQLEFTQYDLDHGDVLITTTNAWPGHDLTFDFFVSDNEGTTIDPFTYTIKSPSITVDTGVMNQIDLTEIGITHETIVDPDAFLIMIQSPMFGQIRADSKVLDERVSISIDSTLEYYTDGKSDASEDSFTLSVYWDDKQEDITVTTVLNKLQLGPQIKGTLLLKLSKRREPIASYALNYEALDNDSVDILYKINEDPLWGMIEKKVGNGFSPLAWGSEFSQEDVDYGLIYYHYYGGDQNDRVDYLGFEVRDKSDRSATEKLEMEILIADDQEEAIAYANYDEDNISDAFDLGEEANISEYFDDNIADEGLSDYNYESSTLAPPTVLRIETNSKHKLTPKDLGIIAPSRSDWIEIAAQPHLGRILKADDGNDFDTASVGELVDGNIIFQSGPIAGSDLLEFDLFFTYDEDRQERIRISAEVVDLDVDYSDQKKDEYSQSSSSTVNDDGDDSSSNGYVEMPSVKNTIEVKRDQIRIITELATLPNTNKNTKFTITSPPTHGNLKLLAETGGQLGRVLEFGDEFTRQDVEDGLLCYEGSNGKGKNTITVREDSFSYTLGDGIYKRFGEITIRVEDFMLRRTEDRSVPGSEVPVDGSENTAFKPDPVEHTTAATPPISQRTRPQTAPAYGGHLSEARIDAFVSIKT